MADSATFQWACKQLVKATPLTELEAAGVLSMALREAGLESRTLDPTQLGVVLEQILASKLKRQAIDDADQTCANIRSKLRSAGLDPSGQAQNPEDVLRRVTQR
jgi:hypothetical protein